MLSYKTYLVERAGVNMGDVFEFVFAAACVSRFTDRYDDGSEMKVTPKSIHRVMDEYFKGNQHWQVASGDGVLDLVSFQTAALPGPALAYIGDSRNRKSSDVSKMIDRAIDAVSDKKHDLSKKSYEVITNGIEDDVDIEPAGTKDQRGTKSDVNVIINGKTKKISLKWTSRQMGQFSGADIVKQLANAWGSVGVKLTNRQLGFVKKAAEKLVRNYTSREDPNYTTHDKGLILGSVGQMYDVFPVVKERNIDKIIDGIKKAMGLSEKDLDVITADPRSSHTISSSTARSLKSKLKIAAKNNSVSWERKSGNNPTVALVANGHTIFQIRTRIDAGKKSDGTYYLRVRTLVESDKGMFEFLEI
jgi:hypothetical protein